MRKLSWKSFVSGVIVGSALFSTISLAAPAAVKLLVNGKEVVSEVPPQIIDGTTMIPARGLAEALGAKVEWDGGTQTVSVQTNPYRELQAKDASVLSPQTAIYLTQLAATHYWYLASGGNMPEGEIRTTKVPGQKDDYRWLGTNVDTKTKYIAYLEEVYTPEQAADYYARQLANGLLAEVDGKLLQPNADGGSLMSWGQAAVKLTQTLEHQRIYHFSVPIGDGEFGYEELEVKLKFIEGTGWRLDMPIQDIR